MKFKAFSSAVIAAALLFTLTACEKEQAVASPAPSPSAPTAEQAEATEYPAAEITTAGDDAAGTDEAWKVEFEKSLMENYGVVPDHYEDIGNGVYQVYVKIDGKIVPYVAVDSATGDYHG